jgi:hypothetical protein
MENMEKFIFTFGIGTPLGKRYQPILANNYEEARSKMFAIYGSNWAGQYTEDEWFEILTRAYKSRPAPTALDIII